MPFGELGASGRPSLDAWLASLAMRPRGVCPSLFPPWWISRLADSELSAAELDAGPPTKPAHVGIIRFTDRPTYYPGELGMEGDQAGEAGSGRASSRDAYW